MTSAAGDPLASSYDTSASLAAGLASSASALGVAFRSTAGLLSNDRELPHGPVLFRSAGAGPSAFDPGVRCTGRAGVGLEHSWGSAGGVVGKASFYPAALAATPPSGSAEALFRHRRRLSPCSPLLAATALGHLPASLPPVLTGLRPDLRPRLGRPGRRRNCWWPIAASAR